MWLKKDLYNPKIYFITPFCDIICLSHNLETWRSCFPLSFVGTSPLPSLSMGSQRERTTTINRRKREDNGVERESNGWEREDNELKRESNGWERNNGLEKKQRVGERMLWVKERGTMKEERCWRRVEESNAVRQSRDSVTPFINTTKIYLQKNRNIILSSWYLHLFTELERTDRWKAERLATNETRSTKANSEWKT